MNGTLCNTQPVNVKPSEITFLEKLIDDQEQINKRVSIIENDLRELLSRIAINPVDRIPRDQGPIQPALHTPLLQKLENTNADIFLDINTIENLINHFKKVL